MPQVLVTCCHENSSYMDHQIKDGPIFLPLCFSSTFWPQAFLPHSSRHSWYLLAAFPILLQRLTLYFVWWDKPFKSFMVNIVALWSSLFCNLDVLAITWFAPLFLHCRYTIHYRHSFIFYPNQYNLTQHWRPTTSLLLNRNQTRTRCIPGILLYYPHTNMSSHNIDGWQPSLPLD